MSDAPEITPEAVASAVDEALAAIAAAATTAELKSARSAHTGEQSSLAQLNAQMRNVAPEHKASFGKLVGQARGQVNQALAARESELAEAETAAQLEAERIDVTALPQRARVGARHPISLLQEQVSDIFVGMGWEIAEGPELEHEWFNFDALNFDVDHPARQMQDTFFVDPVARHLVLRTHTSPVQVRSMLERDLPIYVLCPGRVYRTDEFDATHLPVFTQFEGLVIDKNITMAHLKGTLDHAARVLFGPEAKTRFRANFFPFTEPSAELDLWHPTFKGGARWIEWGGCGMVNPNVLRAAGIDPEEYSGFAFGMGIERTLMFRSDVQDMRDMAEGDVRFSEQFGMVV
ncbi:MULTISPECIES: phenylalanine--tRNA ligase subunit alpha [Microbacterium]|uniref:Phenylalanine--tRNA ligase alpha subunit n=1 Tax=Microbacterium testaceum TaxID=2033 RepID=A0A4Y3QJJ9_MICTE|nr:MULTISPECIES: phenylalanine--tRNA ligase subunit alpha [Microbacterium]MDZ5143153.1 phenylalanine--tRNA ligase subunit alpha [Microbacterium testaceum]PNW08064.1 phenylalanine--tRNA ligase subunit alpha [Microbacterium testaceum]REC99239.1 phenylalanyl-tRNA synthetase alpha subunit [Microbacterium sp. AG157]WJS92030.1 phenylalanine--tRNA ligase subunit alpha [Microbacterium testaceum]GEB44698.1 phenylalanine--tRNA ligase alpha subunit [Microbacterium testaceum]